MQRRKEIDRRNDPFGKSSLPHRYTQEERVLMFAELAKALLENRLPPPDVARFFGGAGMAWLAKGGNLVRDYFGMTGRQGSNKATPWGIYNAHQNEGSADYAQGDFLSTNPVERNGK